MGIGQERCQTLCIFHVSGKSITDLWRKRKKCLKDTLSCKTQSPSFRVSEVYLNDYDDLYSQGNWWVVL